MAGVLDYSSTAASNSTIGAGALDIAEDCAAANINDAIRLLMKDIRDGSDDGNIMGSGYLTKSGAYTVLNADRGKTIDCTAALTLTLTAAATLKAGWLFFVKANGGAMTIDPNASETIDGQTTIVIPDGAVAMIVCDGSNFHTALFSNPASFECQGRLTLTENSPVTTSDVTGAGTVWFEPYKGNLVWLYNGTFWVSHALTGGLSIALSGGTASKPHDVFLDYNAGTPQLAITAWTNDTTRATALTTQDGIYVQTGNTDWRYLGTIYLDGSKQCEDSKTNRHVWNMNNRVAREINVSDSTASWTYSTATWRVARGTGNTISVVRGLDEDAINLSGMALFSHNLSAGYEGFAGIGIDGADPIAGDLCFSFARPSTYETLLPHGLSRLVGVGKRTFASMEKAQGTATQTWYGNAKGQHLQGVTKA